MKQKNVTHLCALHQLQFFELLEGGKVCKTFEMLGSLDETHNERNEHEKTKAKKVKTKMTKKVKTKMMKKVKMN